MKTLPRLLLQSVAGAVSAALSLALLLALALTRLPALAPPALGELASGYLGRTLTVEALALDGSLERPLLVLREVRLANAPWGAAPHFARAARVGLRPDLGHLAQGADGWLAVDVEGVEVALETNADGAGNWALPLAPDLEDTAVPLRSLTIRGATLGLPAPDGAAEIEVAEASLDLSNLDAPRLSAQGDWGSAPWILEGVGGPAADLLSGVPWTFGGRLALAGAEARLDGRLDGDTLSGRVSASGPTLAEAATLAGLDLPDRPFSLEGDLAAGPRVLTLDRLSASLGPTRVSGELRLAWDGPRPRLTGRLGTASLVLPTDEGPGGAIPGPPPGLDASVDIAVDRLTAGRVELKAVRTRIGWAGATLTLSPLSLRLAGTEIAGEASLDFKGKGPTLRARLDAPELDLSALAKALGEEPPVQGTLTRARLELRGRPHRLGGLRLDLKAGAAEIRIPADDRGEPLVLRLSGITGGAAPGGPLGLSGRALLERGEAQWQLRGPTLAQIVAPPDRIPLTLVLESGPVRLRLEGQHRRAPGAAGLDAQVSLESERIEVLGRLIGQPLPSAQPLRAEARVSITERKLSIRDLRLDVGPTRVTGDLTLLRRGDAVRVSGDFRTPRLDLADTPILHALFAPQGAADPTPSPERLFPDLGIPRLPDTPLEGRLRIDARQVAARGQDLGSLRLALELEGRELVLEPEIQLVDGTGIALRLELDDAGEVPALRQRLRVTNLDYGALLGRLKVSDAVTGHLALELDLVGKGADLRTLLAGADGHLRLVAGPGRFPGGALRVWSNELALLLLPGNWDVKAPAHLKCAIADVRIEKGQAASEVLLLDTEKVTVLGNLTIDLETEALGGQVQPLGKGPSLVSLKTPAQVSGTLMAPKAAPSAGDTLTTLGLLAAASTNPVALVALFGSLGTGHTDVCDQALQGGGKGPVSIRDESVRAMLDGMFRGLGRRETQ